jgi:hypothetical protein
MSRSTIQSAGRVAQVSRGSRPGTSLLDHGEVKRGLVEMPDLWRWSSFRAYAYQETGLVRLNQRSVPVLKLREVTTFARVSKTARPGAPVLRT